MKRAKVIIGAGFGDEGKGLMVDYFPHQSGGKPIVIRFNGGAQAGHTVVTPAGRRHIFHHFGAGTFACADTYLSQFFLLNPVAWKQEAKELWPHREPNFIYVHPAAPVTTVYEMFLNQELELSRGESRHGSCGMGVHETIVREQTIPLCASDLYAAHLEDLVELIRKRTAVRLIDLGLATNESLDWLNDRKVFEQFIADCRKMSDNILLVGEVILEDRDVIFEGAQGLLLDACNQRFFPHVTHSRTGLTNVLPIARKAGLGALDVIYVGRTYLTRHGPGELPNEDKGLWYEDTTNMPNEWQGTLRFAPQNNLLLKQAIYSDLKEARGSIKIRPQLALTHCDQFDGFNPDLGEVPVGYRSYGPTSADIAEQIKEEAA